MSHLFSKSKRSKKATRSDRSPSPTPLDEIAYIFKRTSTPKPSSSYSFDNSDENELDNLQKLSLTVRGQPSKSSAHRSRAPIDPSTSGQQASHSARPASDDPQLSTSGYQPPIRTFRPPPNALKSSLISVENFKKLAGQLTPLSENYEILKKRVDLLEAQYRKIANRAEADQPDQNGLVRLHRESKIKIDFNLLRRIIEMSSSASVFVLNMLPYLFKYEEVYRRSLRNSSRAGGVRKIAIDQKKISDLLRCADSHYPGYNESAVRTALSNHLKNLNCLADEIKRGEILNDDLRKKHKLRREHLKLSGFADAYHDRFAKLDRQVDVLVSGPADPFAGLFDEQAVTDEEEEQYLAEHPNALCEPSETAADLNQSNQRRQAAGDVFFFNNESAIESDYENEEVSVHMETE